jgi:hypothetical protein
MAESTRPRPERDVAAEFRRARQAGRTADRSEPRAIAACYDRASGRVEIDLRDGSFYALPAENAEGLRGASPEQLARVEIVANGFALRWPALDAYSGHSVRSVRRKASTDSGGTRPRIPEQSVHPSERSDAGRR